MMMMMTDVDKDVLVVLSCMRGSLCVYVCTVLICSAAKLQVCFNKLTLDVVT